MTNYIRLRQKGFGRKTALACCPTTQHWLRTIGQVIYWSLFLGCLLYWTSDFARAGAATERDKAEAYSHELERVVAQCLREKGGLVKVGDEWFICEAISIGRFPNESH